MRSRFQQALDAVLIEEGLYDNDPDDAGGETFRGIARNYHPDWIGWSLVDAEKSGGILAIDRARELDRTPKMRALIEAFYFERFWSQCGADHLPLPVGERVFDIAVNCGPGRAVELLQVAVAATVEPIVVDGKMGPQTLTAVKRAETGRLFDCLQAAHGSYYVGQIAAIPKKRKWRRGWLARAFREHPALEEGATA